jgi:hypothetical protein
VSCYLRLTRLGTLGTWVGHRRSCARVGTAAIRARTDCGTKALTRVIPIAFCIPAPRTFRPYLLAGKPTHRRGSTTAPSRDEVTSAVAMPVAS